MDELDASLIEFLRATNEPNSDGSLFGSTLRRSGRRSARWREARDSSDLDPAARERHPSTEQSLSRTNSLRKRSRPVRTESFGSTHSNPSSNATNSSGIDEPNDVDASSAEKELISNSIFTRSLSGRRPLTANITLSNYRPLPNANTEQNQSDLSSAPKNNIEHSSSETCPKDNPLRTDALRGVDLDKNTAVVAPRAKEEPVRDDNNNNITTIDINSSHKRAVVAPLQLLESGIRKSDLKPKDLKSPIEELIAITTSINKSLAMSSSKAKKLPNDSSRSRLPIRTNSLTNPPSHRQMCSSVNYPIIPTISTTRAISSTVRSVQTPSLNVSSTNGKSHLSGNLNNNVSRNRSELSPGYSTLRYQTPLPKMSLVMKANPKNAMNPQATFRRASLTTSKKSQMVNNYNNFHVLANSMNTSLLSGSNGSSSRSTRRSQSIGRSQTIGPSFMKQTSSSAAKLRRHYE